MKHENKLLLRQEKLKKTPHHPRDIKEVGKNLRNSENVGSL